MKILFFTNNYWLMKFAPLALALAAVVIFFCNLYAHIWNGAIIYLPLLFLGLYGKTRFIKSSTKSKQHTDFTSEIPYKPIKSSGR